MHRFGRADQRWRERWGGGFLVAVVLLLAGAWMLGDRIASFTETGAVTGGELAAVPEGGESGAAVTDLAGYPRPLTLYMLQAGAFSSPERAQKHAETLKDLGLAAQVAQVGNLYKVFVGAYATETAAKAARHQFMAAHADLSLFPSRLDIEAEPAVTASTAAQGTYAQGVAALNGYLHAAAGWWDAFTAGAPASTAELAQLAGQVRSTAEQLSAFSTDLEVNRFIALADEVADNHAQLENLGQNPDSQAQFQAAMDSYLALVGEYRKWVESGS